MLKCTKKKPAALSLHTAMSSWSPIDHNYCKIRILLTCCNGLFKNFICSSLLKDTHVTLNDWIGLGQNNIWSVSHGSEFGKTVNGFFYVESLQTDVTKNDYQHRLWSMNNMLLWMCDSTSFTLFIRSCAFFTLRWSTESNGSHPQPRIHSRSDLYKFCKH